MSSLPMGVLYVPGTNFSAQLCDVDSSGGCVLWLDMLIPCKLHQSLVLV